MTTKKRRLLLVSFFLAGGATLGVLAMLPPSLGVTKANFDCIRPGMTLAEVEQVFGQKAKRVEPFYRTYSHWMGPGALAIWEAEDGSGAFIELGPDFVHEAEWVDSKSTFIGKLRRWLRLP